MPTREECLEAFVDFLLEKADDIDEREDQRRIRETARTTVARDASPAPGGRVASAGEGDASDAADDDAQSAESPQNHAERLALSTNECA